MKNLNTIGLLVLLVLLTPALCAAQTSPPQPETTTTTTTNAVERARQEAPKETSVVRGRAVYDDTGRPVRRARVLLLEADGKGPERNGMTNALGEFQIKGVRAGTYYVMVDAAGIITPMSFIDLGEANSEKVGLEEVKKHFDQVVVNGTNDVTVKVRARRGGAISGKVTYSDGDAAINVRVTVMRKKDGRVAAFMTNFNPANLFGIQTDDRGMYRIAGLPPGEYIISASEAVDHSDSNMHSEDFMFGSASLVVTYYPSASKQSGATAIQVDAGQEQNEINITLAERPLRTLSGTVASRRDNTPVNAQVSLTSKESMPPVSPFTAELINVETDEQGRFTFNEIPDGSYTLTVVPTNTGEDVNPAALDGDGDEDMPTASPTPDAAQQAAPKHRYISKKKEVTVSGGDLTDVLILLTDGASVSGTVTVEGGRPVPEETIVRLEPLDSETVGVEQQKVQRDGTFTMSGIESGAFYPHVLVEQDEQYYIKSATMNGADLMSQPLNIGDDSNLTGIQIVISPDGANLSGHIMTANNAPAGGRQLALIPTDQSRWRAPFSFLFFNSEVDGSYSVSGAPGEYFVVFLRDGDQPRAINEAWIRARTANALRVALQPREHKTLNLTAPTQ
ncbi:MAG: carboxypeptidase regulatory-like domain-containing protein [Acidobacteria bacterium]|nr:carboxypeptidase regulatory-like domain-containing protein [Acidobacteriota bacterium]